MKKKLGTTLVALATVLAFAACDGIVTECEECPTCPTEEEPGSGDTQSKAYKISLETNEFIYVFDLPESADEDEEVSFRVLTESGYYASNVSVTYKGTELREVIPEQPLEEETDEEETSEGENSDDDTEPEEKEPEYEEVEVDIEVELKGSASAGYSFIMPDKDVTVHAEGLGAYFNIGYDSDFVVHTDYNDVDRKMSAFWHGIYEPVTGSAIGTGTSNFIQAGRELLIVAERPYTAENIQLYANGEKLEEVTDPEINADFFAFAYTMPTCDVQITATADLRYMNVTLDTSDLVDEDGNPIVDAYLYTDDDNTQTQTLTGQKVANDKPYIHAEINEGYAERYSIDSVIISWNRYTQTYNNVVSENSKETSWTATTSSTDTSGTAAKVDDNTRKFQIPSAYYSDNEITVTFTLIDLIKYQGYGFVGTWTGYEFYNGSKYGSKTSTTLAESGTFSSSSSYLNGMKVTDVADDNLTCTLSDGRTFFNDGKVAAILWGSSTQSQSDCWILANGADDITMDIWKKDSYQWCVRVLVESECVGTIYSTGQGNSPLFIVGVSIDFKDDNTTLATSSNFTITAPDGTVLVNVTA
ncbi:MAG: hypothetical protein LUD22_04280 [Coprobacillus sp.]|nr:hypothetical protein [Coprobacillus sp.]